MEKTFGHLADGREARLYTIENGRLRAEVTDYGASLVSLFVDGVDVCLGCDDVRGYEKNGAFLGATVGRNANRMRGAGFLLNGVKIQLPANEGSNNLHSGPDSWGWRLWEKTAHTVSSLTLSLHSPHGDQGFPGNADVSVTYTIEHNGLTISYRAVSDRDTAFNLTNHAYFNLFGQDKPERAMEQELQIPGGFFCPDDDANIPTGEVRRVQGTPFDFRKSKLLSRDIGMDYEPLHLQGGFDHNFVNSGEVCAILRNPENGLTMTVTTDLPGVQVYTGNFLDNRGKGGIYYGKRSGVALETQYFPDSVNHPEWDQPFVKAGEKWESETRYAFE
ncbi:MAG: galactose mutarotase [Oscillospiraceae bacterium]|nr:galactose mutarotase [Oscillospiraceae bacterium]